MSMEQHEEGGASWDDPDFGPPPPKEPYFDSTHGAWILSRYTDVAAAMRERALHLASSMGRTFPDGEDDEKRSRQFAQVRAEITIISAAKWRSEAEGLAHGVICEAMSKERIDLLGDVILPWCISILLALIGSTLPDPERISELARFVHCKQSSNSGSPIMRRVIRLLNRLLPFKYCNAERQLDLMFERKELAVSKPMFMAVSQTLPSFLAKSWLALLRNPAEALRLRAEPTLMPNAVDELVRYAGIVHTLFRKADIDIDVGGIHIAKGQLVSLKVASANFDSARFVQPYRLDVSRRPAGQLGLGSGLHACIGAALVRQAFTLLTPLFLAAGPILDHNQHIVWHDDSMLRRPLAVFVNFGELS
jgi:cytochrome P450